MSDPAPASEAPQRPPSRAYPGVFLAAAASVGFALFRGVGSLLSPEAAPPALLSLAGSTAAAAGFGALFTLGLLATHALLRIPLWESELLLFQALPATWLVLCYDGFKDLDPEGSPNSAAFLLLACFWFFNRKDWSAALLAGRTRAWCMAALFCAAAFLAGMLLLVAFPFSWAWVLIVIQGLAIAASTQAVPAAAHPIPALQEAATSEAAPEAATSEAAPEAARPRSLKLALIALGAVVGLGGVSFHFSGPVAREQLRALLGAQEAQFRLGWRYREGRGVPQDFSRAAHYFEEAATSGSARAQYDLGILQYYGLGTSEGTGVDRHRWLERASGQDYAPALTMLGLIAQRDEHDGRRALELWRRAAALHDPFAEYLLGTAYLDLASDPVEGERNLTRALFWLEKARRASVNPVGGLLPQLWATVPDEALERVTATVFENLAKGTEP